ncbi:MAG: efflux RND transporter periplasmic adaptor subunit [Pseudomonadota bacterium]
MLRARVTGLGLCFALAACGVEAAGFDCLLQPSRTVELGTSVNGVIAEYFVDRGDRVRSGDPVAQLEASSQQAAVELARARAEFGKRKVARNQDLYRDDLLSIHDKDEVETESLIAELELNQASVELSLRTIRSPVDGVVMERQLDAGELVRDGVIATLARVNPLHVEVVVPVAYIGQVAVGEKAMVRPEAPVGGEYEATVTVVDSVVDAASGTFGVRLRLPNNGAKVPAGIRCQVAFAD